MRADGLGSTGSALLLIAVEARKRLGLPIKVRAVSHGNIIIDVGGGGYIFLPAEVPLPFYLLYKPELPMSWIMPYYVKASLEEYTDLFQTFLSLLLELSDILALDLLGGQTGLMRVGLYVDDLELEDHDSLNRLLEQLGSFLPPPMVPAAVFTEIGGLRMFRIEPSTPFSTVYYYPPFYVIPSISTLFLNLSPYRSPRLLEKLIRTVHFPGEMTVDSYKNHLYRLVSRVLSDVLRDVEPVRPSRVMRELGVETLTYPALPGSRLRRLIYKLRDSLVQNEEMRSILSRLYQHISTSPFVVSLEGSSQSLSLKSGYLYRRAILDYPFPMVHDLEDSYRVRDLIDRLLDHLSKLFKDNLITVELVSPSTGQPDELLRAVLPVIVSREGRLFQYGVLPTCLVPVPRSPSRYRRTAPVLVLSASRDVSPILPELLSFIFSSSFVAGGGWYMVKVPVKIPPVE